MGGDWKPYVSTCKNYSQLGVNNIGSHSSLMMIHSSPLDRDLELQFFTEDVHRSPPERSFEFFTEDDTLERDSGFRILP